MRSPGCTVWPSTKPTLSIVSGDLGVHADNVIRFYRSDTGLDNGDIGDLNPCRNDRNGGGRRRRLRSRSSRVELPYGETCGTNEDYEDTDKNTPAHVDCLPGDLLSAVDL
jgi:hypothetical protein